MVMALMLGCTSARPDDPESAIRWSDADEVEFVDGPKGQVRVHYSDRGPNCIDQSDHDGDDIPDLASATADEAESALAFFRYLGFVPPISDGVADASDPGGSPAVDVYLLDLVTTAGALGLSFTEQCTGRQCSTYILAQSDEFSISATMAYLVFRAVENAYDATEPAWLLNGGADWMVTEVEVYAPVGYSSVQPMLDEPECGLTEIEFYGRCDHLVNSSWLFWQFLADTVGPEVLLKTMQASVELDGIDALEAGLSALGLQLAEVWPAFVAANLAVGPRADEQGYWFADRLEGVTATAEGKAVRDTRSYKALSARYYRIDHPGGELWLGTGGDPAALVVTVHPVDHGKSDGPLESGTGPFGLPTGQPLLLGEFEAGGIWLAVSNPAPRSEAATITLCAGARADASPCGEGEAGCSSGPGAAGFGSLALIFGTLLSRRQKPSPP